MFSHRLSYSHEFKQKIRVGFAGCGGQAFRNLLPGFQYSPIELLATCDIDLEKANAYARQFGALRSYDDYDKMLEKETLDAVFLATGYNDMCLPNYPEQARKAMESGCHVWFEKPPASSMAEIENLQKIKQNTGRQIGIGFMKMFTPSASKVKEIIHTNEFGSPTTFYLRDPEKLPPREHRNDPRKMIYLLDHIVHPASLIHFLMGPLRRMYVEEGPDGEAMIVMKFINKACGVLHMPWGQSGTSPMERLEVVGQGANVVVQNNTRLTYYRQGHRGLGSYEYGRIGDFIGADDHAPLYWEMDCYSGQPFNMHLFYQGYAQEILYFCQCLLQDKQVSVGGIGDAWHIMRFYEALKSAGRTPIEFDDAPTWTLS
jgi:predicted dehydrogenase